MSKGRQTRDAILQQGIALAYKVGLEGLTIGALATEVEMSKSGMFAHFGSKQALQLAVLDAAAEDFAAAVVRPALAAPRGEARVRALVDRWLHCGLTRRPGGCLFVKASVELDEQPGPVRDRLVELHEELDDSLARVFAGAVAAGELRPDADPRQLAADLYGAMLGFYHRHRLLADAEAEQRLRRTVDALLDSVRVDDDASTAPRGPHVPGADVRADDGASRAARGGVPAVRLAEARDDRAVPATTEHPTREAP
ncbi:TetR/AcrR family transcriptional regulator [Cellulomonas sp. APG4]|uniref:TetR/AcrR family transcriptional regulator n=1 Tax=Cellulomonas sp. APG4 TaxID=1538656 RepID=UPI00137B3903|nr:TetR/AcrR family transcriptional regulator [Cellulomonas sp. APG4]